MTTRCALSPLIAIALLFLPDAPAVVEAEALPSVKIDLSRPFQAGQVFSYAAVGRSYRETVVSTRGAVVTETVIGTRCELAAALAIDEVREDGQPLAVSVRVFRLMIRDGFLPAEEGGAVDAGEQPLKSGTEIAVRYPEAGAGEPDVALADGSALDASLAEALLLVLPGPAGTRDDDVLFGKQGQATAGDTWPINVEETVSALTEGGIEVPADRLEGDVTLRTMNAEAGEHEINVVLRGDRAGVPLPSGYITRGGTLKVRLSTTLPDDSAKPLRRESAEYSLKSQAMGREGEQLMVVDLAFFQSRTARYDEVVPSTLEAAAVVAPAAE